MAHTSTKTSNKKTILTTSKSLPVPPYPTTLATSQTTSSTSSSQTTVSIPLRSATSLTSMAPARALTSSAMLVTSLLVMTFFVTSLPRGAALPSAATSLRFDTQPSDRPLALYRAPAPYQQSGKPTLNSVIITSKPFSISEHQQLATTSSPSTASSAASSARASLSSLSSSLGASASSPWRRISHSPTTDRPAVTLTLPQYSIDCAEGMSCSETIAVESITPRPTFKPYPQDVLDKFLRQFANTRVANDPKPEESTERATNRLANLYLDNEDERTDEQDAEAVRGGGGGEEGGGADSEESEGKSRWHLLHATQHHHPYDDRDGWVTLEPVPWSTSKVSKWHATHTKRPEYKPPNRFDARPPLDWDKPSRPSFVRPSYDDDYETPQRPSSWGSRPQALVSKPWEKPTNEYEFQKPLHWASASTTVNHDIITDNRPNRWPDTHTSGNGGYRPWQEQKPLYDYSVGSQLNRPGSSGFGLHDTNRHPPNHPEESDGQWVLVSSTKGYAVPHRHKIFQRALAISAKPITSRRTVRLTVLPALNGTANTTISHGGLLEVESTFQSVEQEHQQQQQQQQQQDLQQYLPQNQDNFLQHDLPTPVVQTVRPKARGVRFVAHPTQDNSRAVLAAVGAGMVPATLALMAPLVLGRRRRRRSLLRSQRSLPARSVDELIRAFKRSPMIRMRM